MNNNRILLAAGLAILLSAPVTARDLPRTNPAAAGLSPARLERLDAYIDKSIEAEQFAGAVVLIARRGKLAYLKSYGMADREAGRPMRTDDLIRIMSMSKAITSTAVMMLFEEGRFMLDDPVLKYLPEFDRDMQVVSFTADGYELVPANGPITIRHLLTHTSGLTYRFLGAQPFTDLYAEAGIRDGLASEDMSLQQLTSALAAMPLAHQPGKGWTYGLSTDVLGRLVEVVSGLRFDRFLAERLFEPLQMRDTYFAVPRSKHGRIAVVYRNGANGKLERIPDGVIVDGLTEFSVDYPYSGRNKLLSGGAGLTSTAPDYARFLQMMLNGGQLDGERILGRKTVELMTSDQIKRSGLGSFNPSLGFSLGFSHDAGPAATGLIGSPGVYAWGGFFNTDFWVDPEEELVAVLMTQHYPFGIELLGRFRVLVYQAISD